MENNSVEIKSSIEKIMLEISNEKRKAAEERNSINEKLNIFSITLSGKVRRKFRRYRGERSSQMASFEERI